MAVRIRLKRIGRKKRPFYRVVVVDSRTRRDGREIERLGYYNPLPKEPEIKLNKERILHWLENGAQPTDTVMNLLKKQGIALQFHLKKSGAKESDIDKEIQKWEMYRDLKSKSSQTETKKSEPETTEAQETVEETETAEKTKETEEKVENNEAESTEE